MNREIKFRAWHTTKCEWWYFTLDSLMSNGNIGEVRENEAFLKNRTQYTGLKDKNGKEIYEGDIVRCYDHPTNKESGDFEIWYSNGAFLCKGSPIILRDWGTAWTEVIGNIYENPELLNTDK